MRSFGECLAFHLANGTRPNGRRKLWDKEEFARATKRDSGRAVGNWLNNKHVPKKVSDLEWALFGDNSAEDYASWRAEFNAAHQAYWQKDSPQPAPLQWTGRPYPGLRRFEPHEAAIFFGRERESGKLAELLLDPLVGFIAVVGASGTGKSSLVSAGALSALAAKGHAWPVLSFSPGYAGDNPFLALAIELAKQLAPPMKVGELAHKLAVHPASIADYAREVLKSHAADSALVLFVDQFEELFKDAAEQHRQSFIELIVAAADEGRIRTIVTLREDFQGAFANEPFLAELVQQCRSSFPLGVPPYSALVKMIQGPAELAGLMIDDELIDQLMADAGPVAGEALPLVAFCLEELHRHVHPRPHLTKHDYDAIGGLRGAIGKRLDDVLKGLGLDENQLKAALEQIFPLVVHVDAAGKTLRRWAPRHAIASLPEPVPKIAETLIEKGLLFARLSEMEDVVTLRHEALIQEWADLHNWVLAIGSFLQRMHSHLLLLQTPSDRDHAFQALVVMSRERCIPILGSLTNLLGDADRVVVRRKAAEALGLIGPNAAAAVPALMEALLDNVADVREAAAGALGWIGPAAAAAVPALIGLLGDADADVRDAVIEALDGIGPAAAEAVPALMEALRDADNDVREAAADALAQIETAAATAVPSLIEALRDADPVFRQLAAEVLGRISPAAVAAVPALMEALRDADSDVRGGAAIALGNMGPAAVTAAPALIEAQCDAELDVRSCATRALVLIGLQNSRFA